MSAVMALEAAAAWSRAAWNCPTLVRSMSPAARTVAGPLAGGQELEPCLRAAVAGTPLLAERG